MTNDMRPSRPQRGRASLFTTAVLSLCALIAAFTVVGYAVGWVTFQQDDQREKATIEVETGKVRKAAEEAVDKGQELLQKAGDNVDNMMDRSKDDATTDSAPVKGIDDTSPGGTDSSNGDTSDPPQG